MGESGLKNKNSQFNEIFDKSPIGILFYDKNGNLTDANQSALEIAGIPSLNVCIKFNLFDNPNVNSRKEELLEKGFIKFQASLNFDNIKKSSLYNPTKSGTAFIDYTVSVTDSRFLVQIQDITDNFKMSLTLKENEKLFREIFNNANDVLLLHKIEKNEMRGKFIEVNEMAVKRLGYTRDEFLKMSPKDIDDPQKKMILPGISEELHKNGHATFEINHVSKNGVKIPMEVNAHIFTLGEEKVILSVARDITERKKAERELKEAHETLEKQVKERTLELEEAYNSLKESEEKYKQFFEASPNFTVQVGMDG